jgi:hypothetical protein
MLVASYFSYAQIARDNLAKKTDPAAELAQLLDSLSGHSDVIGSQWLATKFGVEEWSLDFYQIIFSIIQRIEGIRGMLASLEGFEHLRSDIEGHLDALKLAFTTTGLQVAWVSYGANHVNRSNIQPLKMCSAFLRAHISYPDLSIEERDQVIYTVNDLLKWLLEHQLEENDFIRQAIIEGLEQFLFRIERLEWLGWGYSLESLKSVVMAYIALERGFSGEATTPNTGAALKKVGAGLKAVFEVVGVSKDIVERADFALKAYGVICLTLQGASIISGLLTNSPSGPLT